MPRLLPVGEVNASTVFAGSLVPDLGLTGNPDEEFRVYVLASGDRYYVGVEDRILIAIITEILDVQHSL